MADIVVRLDGAPQGKGRPKSRFVQPKGKAGFVHVYTPAATRAYESLLQTEGVKVMAGRPPIEGPLAVVVWAIMPVAPSWPKKKIDAALTGVIMPTGKPDADNIFKMVDSLNKIVWNDDSQIVNAQIIKLYGEWPALIVEVGPADLKALPKFPGYGD